MAKMTWPEREEREERATAKAMDKNKSTYSVTMLLPNGATPTYKVMSTSPSTAMQEVLCNLYDTSVYSWFITDLNGKNSIYGRPNMVVQKLDGIRKTQSYYRIEVVTKEIYNERMEMCRRHEEMQNRFMH